MCVRNGSQRLVGKTALILKEYEDLAWGAFMNIIRPKEKNTFLFHYLNSEKFRGQIYADFNTATVNQITIGTLNGCYITIPCSKTSREKIACFLDLIEERIHTQSKIIGTLKSLISALRSKIIGESNWSWLKLSEAICDKKITIKRGNIIPKHEKNEHYAFPVYSSSVQNDGLMGYNNSFMFDRELITWSIDGGGDFFHRLKHKFNVTNVCGIFELNNEEWSYAFAIEALKYQHSRLVFDYQSKAHPSVIENLYSLPIVDAKMQNKISNLFRSVYKKLQTEMTLLVKLKEQKKYLLSNMFI